MNSVSNILLILFTALIGLDRINLLPNDDITLTPFLIVSFLLLFYNLIFKFDHITPFWLKNNSKFLLLLVVFLCFVVLSIPLSQDIYFSFKRLILLLYIIIVITVIFLTYKDNDIFENLYLGSIVGSFIFYIFNILLLLYWLGLIKVNYTFINIEPHTLSYFIPRLGGFSEDVNRGGFVLIFYTYLLLISKNKIKFNWVLICLNMFFIICTLSRTSILFFIITLSIYIFYYASKKDKRVYFINLLIVITVFSFSINYFSNINIIDFTSVIEERLSIEDQGHDSSSSIHLKLINDALDTIISSGKIFIIGNGLGTSYKTIKGYRMSGTKNANYHSQYLSIFVENGFFAFLSFLFLTIIYPIYNNKSIFYPMIIGVFIFNIFYQLINEPAYWFLIFLFYHSLSNKYYLDK